MARGLPHADGPVAVEVEPSSLLLEQDPVDPRLLVVGLDVAAGREPVGRVRVLVLVGGGDDLRVGELVDRRHGARVVEVQMRLQDEADARRVEAVRLQRRDACLLRGHDRVVHVEGVTPVGALVLGALGRVAAVDDDVAARVGDQEPRHRDLVRLTQPLAHLDVLDVALERAALEHVQPDIVGHGWAPPLPVGHGRVEDVPEVVLAGLARGDDQQALLLERALDERRARRPRRSRARRCPRGAPTSRISSRSTSGSVSGPGSAIGPPASSSAT